MELINNTTKTLRDDLSSEIKKGSKLSIAAACFSIYAFQELKKQLKDIEELRFIFTSPAFIREKPQKEKREFYIPRLNRERSLYGTEFEVKLRNELNQKAIAKECAEWIRKKVAFKSNVTDESMMGFINVDDKNYMPVNGFTTVDLGCERGNYAYNMVQKTEAPFSLAYLQLFEQCRPFRSGGLLSRCQYVLHTKTHKLFQCRERLPATVEGTMECNGQPIRSSHQPCHRRHIDIAIGSEATEHQAVSASHTRHPDVLHHRGKLQGGINEVATTRTDYHVQLYAYHTAGHHNLAIRRCRPTLRD